MLRFILVLFMVLGVTGCASKGNLVCEGAKKIAKPVSVSVGKAFDCKNTLALETWMVAKLEGTQVCAKDQITVKSFIGEMVCPTFIDSIIEGGLSYLPEAAQCSGGDLADGARSELMRICTGAL